MIKNIDLKFTDQKHYNHGGIDTMDLIDAKLTDEMYIGLTIADVVRYCLRYPDIKNFDDLEKALTMLAWGVHRIRQSNKND